MRVIFAGTPEFARVALEHIHRAGHTVALVLTQPDRPAGRGLQLQASPVKTFALAHGLPVAQPRSLREDGNYPQDAALARAQIAQAQADVMVVAAYGLLLPQWVLDALAAPRSGCINIHGSLLPRWRGAAPIHRAIEAGDRETGVTIMQMDAGLDTGDILALRRIAIKDEDTTGTVHDALALLGAQLLLQVLDGASAGTLEPVPQPAQGACYAPKIAKNEAPLDWYQSATVLDRRVRAFVPFPGALASLRGEAIKVWRARVDGAATRRTNVQSAAPGTVLAASEEGIAVATGDGVLVLLELQRAGGKRLAAGAFLRGFAIAPGVRFDTALDAAPDAA
jgi:methionyl-tRNA formyltransferase